MRTTYYLSYFFNPKKGEQVKTAVSVIRELATRTGNYYEALQVLHAFSIIPLA